MTILRVGKLTIDPDKQSVAVLDQAVPFARKEYTVLEYLLLHKGELVSKEALYEYVYGAVRGPRIGIIPVFISNIRSKLADMGAPDVIRSGRTGYMFVERHDDAAVKEFLLRSRLALSNSDNVAT